MSRKESVNEIAFENKKEEMLDYEADGRDEASKKAKRLNMFIGIFSVICALTIWMYASAISEAELKLQSPVNLKYVLDAEHKGYEVHYNRETKINFTVNGKVLALSQISNKGITISADLSTINYSEITTEKIVQLPLIFNLPEGVTCSEKSQEYIEVSITKKSID